MRLITQKQFGGPEVLTVEEAPIPEPLSTEVVVKVAAIGLNPLEAWLRSGDFALIGTPPFVLGWDVSGVVTAASTDRLHVGDEVLGAPLFPRQARAYAEYVSAPALHFVRKPAGLSWVEAAALPIVGMTAWQALVDLAHVRPDDRVLVHAGGGGVGHVAIQIAKARGAYVITTASASKHEFVTELGADEVVDYSRANFADVVRDVDIVVDTLGGDTAVQSLDVLRPGGYFVTAVAAHDADLAARFTAAGRRFRGIAVDPDPAGLRAVVDLVERGKLRVHVDRTWPFDEVVEAHRALDAGHITGKFALTL